MRLRLLPVVVLGLLQVGVAFAQQYPAKTVRLIVPTAPGGGTDLIARVLAEKLTKSLGKPFVVDNRGGAGTTLGTDMVAKAPADGYTIGIQHVSLGFNATYYKHLPYDTLKDFAPITLVATQPYLLVVHPALPVTTVGELVALAKARPGQIAYASGGVGSGPFMAAELLKAVARINLLHVPYRGAGLAFGDLLGGQVQAMIATVSLAAPHVKAGKVRALGATSAKRLPGLSEVPTIAESGVPGYEFTTWYGIIAPVGTPRTIVVLLNQEIAKGLDDADTRERFAGDGIEPLQSLPDEFAAFLKQEVEKWAKVVKATGLHAE